MCICLSHNEKLYQSTGRLATKTTTTVGNDGDGGGPSLYLQWNKSKATSKDKYLPTCSSFAICLSNWVHSGRANK